MRRFLLIIIFALLSRALFAPSINAVFIASGETIELSEILWKATCEVESGNNPLKISESEQAYGIVQIRQAMLTDFNKDKMQNKALSDVLSEAVSKDVFCYHFKKIIKRSRTRQSPDQIIEVAARSWGAGYRKRNGPGGDIYWSKIKKQLEKVS